MILHPGRALADAWALWKRDRALLLPIAGLSLFLPQLAQLLLLPPSPEWPVDRSPEILAAWFETSYSQWVNAYGPWIILGYLVVLFGSVVILTLFLDEGRPDVRGAFRRAVKVAPRFILASFLAGVPIGLGYLLVLPGIYLLGRLMLAGPAIVASGDSATKALARSWRVTRGSSLPAFGLAALILLGGSVATEPFLMLGRAMTASNSVNPVALGLLDIGASLVAAAAGLAMLLVEIAVWRQLVRD
ncbi:hypothetical protein BH09PSE4_BH09PSE4_16930 [soil metagenome]